MTEFVAAGFKFCSRFEKTGTSQKTDVTLYFQILLILTLYSIYFRNLSILEI